MSEIVKVPISNIEPNPYQPDSRIEIPDDTAEKFGKSILEHGLLQTPVARQVNDRYEMGDGWLRLSGFRWLVKNGHPEFQEMPLSVRDLNDRQMADLVLEANEIRQNLNPIEKAKLFRKYIEDFGITQAELGRTHNVTQGEIGNTLRLLELPAEIQTKIISQEITPTHGRTLLQLPDKREIAKMATRLLEHHLSVADLDREVKDRIWQSTMPLFVEQWSSEKPVFDLAGCESCEHRQLMKGRWSSEGEEKKPRCADKKCWTRKQNAALQEQHKEALAKLAAKGITNIVEYDFRSMGLLRGSEASRTECRQCEKRAATKPSYHEALDIVCTDRACYNRLEKIQREAEEAKQKEREQKAEQEVDHVFESLELPGKHIPLGIINCFLRSNEYSYGHEEMIEKITSLFAVNPPKQKQKATIKSVMAFCRGLREDELFYKILPRLAFELFRRHCNDSAQEKQALDIFQSPIEPEPLSLTEEQFRAKANGLAAEDIIETRLSSNPKDYVLGHTYRLSFTDHSFTDVTAQDAYVAIAAAGKKPEDVERIKVFKSNGKKGTGGGIAAGWSKCTELIQVNTQQPTTIAVAPALVNASDNKDPVIDREAELRAAQEEILREASFITIAECASCRLKDPHDFHFDPAAEGLAHWQAKCSCGAVIRLPNAYWDGMAGLGAPTAAGVEA